VHVNNNQIAVESARALVSYLRGADIVPLSELERFLALPIRSPIMGFCVTHFPLRKLSCLLDKQWLHEDVLNALGELSYFRQAAGSAQNGIRPHSV
jgi:hypothetical protein